jgi:hypothetical protein
LERHPDIDLRRRRRHKIILFAGTQNDERQYGYGNTGNCSGSPPRAAIQPTGQRMRRLHSLAPIHLVLEKAFRRTLFAAYE